MRGRGWGRRAWSLLLAGATMLGGWAVLTTPQARAAGAITGFLEGSGTMSPGLTLTSTSQSWTFSGTVVGAAESGRASAGVMSCSYSGGSSGGETQISGSGTMSGACSGGTVGTASVPCAIAFTRIGVHVASMSITMSCTVNVSGDGPSTITGAGTFAFLTTSSPTSPWTSYDVAGVIGGAGVDGPPPDPGTMPPITGLPTIPTVPNVTTPPVTAPPITIPGSPVNVGPYPGTTYPSDDCAGGEVAKGWTGGAYSRVNWTEPDPKTDLVCFRADRGTSGWGGRIRLDRSTGLPGTPYTDTNAALCGSTTGNTAPGPHPILSGFVGDPSDPPTYLPYLFDTYSSAAAGTWVCVKLGSTQARLVVPGAGGTQAPTITIDFDASSAHTTTEAVSSGSKSATCQTGATGSKSTYTAQRVGPATVWATSWQETSTLVHVCARAEGPVAAGGRLNIDTTNTGGGAPAITTGSDVTACTISVLHNNSPPLDIRRTPTGAFPSSVCVSGGGTNLRVTATTGNGQPPASVTWEQDT
jgi:hypothetical protein